METTSEVYLIHTIVFACFLHEKWKVVIAFAKQEEVSSVLSYLSIIVSHVGPFCSVCLKVTLLYLGTMVLEAEVLSEGSTTLVSDCALGVLCSQERRRATEF